MDENKLEYIIFDEVKPNPTVINVNDGLKILKENSCDFVISFGGGSPHDAAKGIALLATNGGDVKDYEGVDRSIHSTDACAEKAMGFTMNLK